MFSKFFKRKEEPVQLVDKSLYILIEAPKPGIVSYLEANGVHVKSVTTNIESVISAFIREKNPLRLIIVDLGIGTWKNLESINNITGLISQCSGFEHRDATVFTRNGKLTKEIRDLQLDADVREFKGISDIIRALMEYPENYITSGAVDFDGENVSDLQSYIYKRTDLPKIVNEQKLEDQAEFIDITQIDTQSGEELEGFKCKF